MSFLSLDMFNLNETLAINKFHRSRLIFDVSAKVSYWGTINISTYYFLRNH